MKIRPLFTIVILVCLAVISRAETSLPVFDVEPFENHALSYRIAETGNAHYQKLTGKKAAHYITAAGQQQTDLPLPEEDSVYEVDLDLKYGQKLTGRVTLTLDKNAQIKPGRPAAAWILTRQFKDKNNFELVAVKEFNADGSLQVTFSGRYTDQVKVLLTNVESSGNPLGLVQVEDIILSDKTRIMLLGDSIFWGGYDGAEEGVFITLSQELTNNGYNFDFVGPYSLNDNTPYKGHMKVKKQIHDFYPANFLGGDKGSMDVTSPMNTYRPNIAVIHLGTNDINSEYYKRVAPYEVDNVIQNTQSGEMAILVEYLLKWHNGELGNDLDYIIVSLIVPMEDTTDNMTRAKVLELNTEFNRMALDFQSGRRTGQPEPVYVCDIFSRFQENPDLWEESINNPMYDTMHPKKAGLFMMGREYFKSINYLLTGAQKWFREITWEANVAGFADRFFAYKGISVADVTGDGRDDLYISRTASGLASPREGFYVNNAQLPYTESAIDFHIEDANKSWGTVLVDIDNDGDFDLFNGNSPGSNKLYKNLNNQDFEEITQAAGILDVYRTTTAALAFDCENDGDMDLFALNTEQINEFYLNNGAGAFTSATRGLEDVNETDKYSMSATAADFDNDGDVDVFAVKRDTPCKLWVNDGSGHFTEDLAATEIMIDHTQYKPNGANWADLDNDGDLDLIVTSLRTSKVRYPTILVFKNNGNGTFEDISSQVNIKLDGYTALVADFDNDGRQDILTTNYESYSEMYLNKGNWLFEKQTDTGAEIYAGDIRGGAAFDYDNDGDMDFLVTRSDAFNVLMRNNLNNSNNYLRVQAYGPDNNIGGYGTKIWLYSAGSLGDSSRLLGYQEIISGTGHNSQYSPVQHFGLGANASCDVLARFTDGTLVVVRSVSANQLITIKPELPENTGAVPAFLAEYSGNNQAKAVGQTLDEPVVVKVTDASGLPVPGANVMFQVTGGDAQLYLPEVTHDAISVETETGQLSGAMQWYYDASAAGNGFASLLASLGSNGSAVMQQEIAESSQYVVWLRYANAGATDNVGVKIDNVAERKPTLVSGEGWRWVRINGADGNSFLYTLNSGVHTITINITGGRPHIDKLLLTKDINYTPFGAEENDNQSPNLTDREGLARRFVQLNQTAGPVTVQAGLTHNGAPVSGSPVQFNLTAQPGPAVVIKAVSGNGQAGDINIALAQPFIVSITDAFNNPIAGAPVLFNVVSGGGTINPSGPQTTNAQGQASTTLTPGTGSSIQQVHAIAEGLSGSPVVFTAVVRGVASDMQYISGSNQTAKVVHFLANPVKVKILEENGSPAVGFPVWFSVTSDSGGVVTAADYSAYLAGTPVSPESLTQILTNSEGIAEGYWLLGKNTGTQTLKVDGGAINGSPMNITALATADNPALLLAISGNHQTAPVNQKLADSLTVRVLDAWGNPIAGQQVMFTATNGGRFNGSTQILAQTQKNGNAKAGFTVGQVAGTDYYIINITATFGGNPLPGSPLVFNASATPGPAAIAEMIAGNNQTGIVNRQLPEAMQVKVMDQFRNAIANFAVQFWVAKGNGKIDNQDIVTKSTNNSGVTGAMYKLGSKSGANEVTAVFAGLTPETITFSATGLPDSPAALTYVSGNNQSGVRGMTLNRPFQVRITDAFENNIKNHPVQFDVESIEGTFNGLKTTTSNTDTNGIAEAYLTLGQELGDNNHVVVANSFYIGSPVMGSPITFYASAKRGVPSKIIPVTSASGLLGAPGQILRDSLYVKVCDTDNLPIPDFKVTFQISSGGGVFTANSKDTLSVITNTRGIAGTQWRLGSQVNEQQVKVSALYNQQHLVNSPLYFNAWAVASTAKSITMLSGSQQSGPVGEPLPEPFAVIVHDELGFPVANQPVQFTVISGDGFFHNSADTLVRTNQNGIADIVYTPGNAIGNNAHVIHARSLNKGVELQGSPVLFHAHGEPGITDPAHSSIVVESPVPASGAHYSQITVNFKDKYNNPLPGRKIQLYSYGLAATVTPLSGTTNSSGQFLAQASSPQPGDFYIKAKDTDKNIWLADSVKITFFSTAATKIQRISDESVIAYPGSNLAEPMLVRVTDAQNNPVYSYPVTFTCNHSDAKFQASQPVYTNNDGRAATNLQAPKETGEIIINANAPGLQGSPVQFSIFIMQPENLLIQKVSGDSQKTVINGKLPLPLTVLVRDNDGRPAWNIGVIFSAENSQLALVDSGTVKTDANGLARTTVTMGATAGKTIITAKIIGADRMTIFRVFSFADQAQKMTIHSGNRQNAKIGQPVPEALVVKVSDNNNNGVADVPVQFSVHKGSGTLDGNSLQKTDIAGLAFMNYQFGMTSGENLVRVTTPALQGDTLLFTLTATPDTAFNMAITGGNNQTGVTDHLLNSPLLVQVTDRYGNGVPDVAVTFTPQPGHGQIVPSATVSSDTLGLARAYWRLGSNKQIHFVTATNSVLQNSPLQFQASAVKNNAPVITLAADVFTVNENDSLSFAVHVVDAENDTVTVTAMNLPAGAVFDETIFSWRPSFNQAGTHAVKFTATDHAGAKSEKYAQLTALNVNRPPRIITEECLPANRNLGALKKGQTIHFFVKAVDDDTDDAINYLWYVNQAPKAASANYRFESQNFNLGQVIVTALVYDLEDTVTTTWTADIITAIELQSFSGAFKAFAGIELNWKTRSESDNLGFYVQRSMLEKGPYTQISSLIPANQKGEYNYTDAEAEAGHACYYRLVDVQSSGFMTEHEAICVQPELPKRYTLHQNFPNPFNPSTTIRYELPEPSHISLAVFDILGREVKTLVNAQIDPGYHSCVWDGINSQDLPVAAGVYYVVLKSREGRFVKKIALVK